MITVEQIRETNKDHSKILHLAEQCYGVINEGEHTGISRRTIQDLIHWRITNIAVAIEMMDEGTDSINAEGYLENLLYNTKYLARCEICDCEHGVEYNYDAESDMLIPVNPTCYKLPKLKKYTIKTTSNKFIFLNNVRKIMKDSQIDHLSVQSINSDRGQEAACSGFAGDNIACAYVGNTSTYIFENKGKTELKTWWSKKWDNAERICCDLWWITGIDVSQADPYKLEEFKKSGYDYVEVDVEPNTEYYFEVNYMDSKFERDCLTHKFYKKVK